MLLHIDLSSSVNVARAITVAEASVRLIIFI